MTRIRDWLLFLHILGAILYIGSSAVLTVSVYQARRTGAIAPFLHTIEIAAPVPAVGGILLLLSGIGLVLAVEAWGITTAFVLVGIAVILVSGASESIYFSRQAAALREVQDDPGSSQRATTILTRMFRAAVILDVLYLLAIWAMVFKAGT